MNNTAQIISGIDLLPIQRFVDESPARRKVERTLNDPPVAPDKGRRYLIGAAPTGEWGSPYEHSAQIAEWDGDRWVYEIPLWEWVVFDEFANAHFRFDGNVWLPIELGVKVLRVRYDFEVNGGAVGTIDLGGSIPANAIVMWTMTDVLTTCTSGGSATIRINVGAVQIVAAQAYDLAARYVGINNPAVIVPIKCAAGGVINFVIATADLTNGKMDIHVCYVQGAA